jgi:RHS repeat-associated protein
MESLTTVIRVPLGSLYYSFADALGSTRAVTTSTGATCFDTDYYPYGQQLDHTASCPPTYRFTAYEYDTETGNYYAFFRYYSPRLGRFMTADPLGVGAFNLSNPQSLNRYSYVRNNPVVLIDPLGLDCTDPETGQELPCPDVTSVTVTADSPPQPVCYGYVDVQGAIPMYSEGACFHYWDKMAAGGLLAHFGDVSPQTLQRLARLWARRGQRPHGPAQPPQTQTPSRAVCAANLADKYSIAGAVGTIGKQGFFANVFNGFAGNTFSGLTLAFSGGGNKYRLGTAIENAPPPVGFAVTANAINAVTTPAPITELGLTETVGSELLGEGLGYTIAGLKIGYDALSFAGAYLACGQ